ncbi:protein of unknown function [Cupriavidus taiwanensis]|nr:protein of unknown function [Cupriavidus taiwanensis]
MLILSVGALKLTGCVFVVGE